jgi:hypothetical protein
MKFAAADWMAPVCAGTWAMLSPLTTFLSWLPSIFRSPTASTHCVPMEVELPRLKLSRKLGPCPLDLSDLDSMHAEQRPEQTALTSVAGVDCNIP